ncbi:MAG: DUF1801 domain-containing protein [Balneolaceae bacterium]|jgi:hypothetical protein
MNEKVQRYLEKLPSPQKEICKKVRKIILKTFPGLKESFKNGVPWYEDKFYLVGLKDHVNIGFSIKGLTKKELNSFEGQGKYMRHIKLYSVDEIDEEHIKKLLQTVK